MQYDDILSSDCQCMAIDILTLLSSKVFDQYPLRYRADSTFLWRTQRLVFRVVGSLQCPLHRLSPFRTHDPVGLQQSKTIIILLHKAKIGIFEQLNSVAMAG